MKEVIETILLERNIAMIGEKMVSNRAARG
jgi:hypothetical protein